MPESRNKLYSIIRNTNNAQEALPQAEEEKVLPRKGKVLAAAEGRKNSSGEKKILNLAQVYSTLAESKKGTGGKEIGCSMVVHRRVQEVSRTYSKS